MTAEIIIANSNAIALAADSAVTIGKRKIYNSAIKLFSFSKVEPVGVMIFGNGNLMDVPWEMLIKSFRKNLGAKCENTVEEYGRNFLRFLSDNKNFFPLSSQNEWLVTNVEGYYTYMRNSLLDEVNNKLKDKGNISRKETDNILFNIINSEHNELKNQDFIYGLDKQFEKELRKQKLNIFKKIRLKVFENINFNKTLVRKLNDIAVFLLTRDIFPDNTSGIVIAGYGLKEIYPSVVTYKISGVIKGVETIQFV